MSKADSNARTRKDQSYKGLVDSYEQLTQNVRRPVGASPQIGQKQSDHALKSPSMSQGRGRSASASDRSPEVSVVRDASAADPRSRRTHGRSASATSTAEFMTQSSMLIMVANRHSLTPSKSETRIPSLIAKGHAAAAAASPAFPKPGLLRRLQRKTSELMNQPLPAAESAQATESARRPGPGQVALKILELLPKEAARTLRINLASLRREMDKDDVDAKRRNHRFRNRLVGELMALDDAQICAEIEKLSIGDALNAELDILRSKLEERARFANVNHAIDTGNTRIAAEIDRLYVHHFFEKNIDVPLLPASLGSFVDCMPPWFVASFGEAACTLHHGDGKAEALRMPDGIANDAASQSKWKRTGLQAIALFVGQQADGLLLWTVGEHLGPHFHQFMTELLFNRRGSNGQPESELHRYDGQPVRPTGKAHISYNLQHAEEGGIVIDYSATISATHCGPHPPEAELLTDATQRYLVDPVARLQIDARVIVRSSRDVEITDLRVRANGWNGG